MNTVLLVAAREGVVVCGREGERWRANRRGLAGKRVTCVIGREGVILAGTTEGVFRSDDLGQSWQEASRGLEPRHVRWLAFHPDISDFELAGTEPAAIFLSRDGARNWEGRPEVAKMRQKYGWFLPYSPEAGCVRGFAIHGSRAYAAVEVGGVLVSDDGAQSWRLAGGSRGDPGQHAPSNEIHADVHSIQVHPTSPDLVDAPTGGGFFRSKDGGASWVNLYPSCYCRAVWVDPLDPDHLVLGPASGVDQYGRIEESKDGGRTWKTASDGLEVPWKHTMIERFAQVGSHLLGVLSNGEVIVASLEELSWQHILPEISGVDALASMEV